MIHVKRSYIRKDGSYATYKASRNIPKVLCTCSFCLKQYIGFQGRKYCSYECSQYAGRFNKAIGTVIKQCPVCDKGFMAFTQTKKERFCSTICRTQHDANRVIIKNRAWRSKQREPIYKVQIFKEYDWHCAMCGIDTPQSLMGSYLPNEPTLDHIIPLSKGGLHIRSNVQLLCRRCNCHIKNDKELVPV